MNDNQMTCAECDELVLDYFESSLDGQSHSRFNEHVSTCLRCQALIRDVDGIRDQAAALPDLVPSRDLWSGIEARIQPEVRSIPAQARTSQLSRRWLAVAATALIAVTSGVTYVATSRSFTKQPVGTVAMRPTVAAPQVAVAPIPSSAPDAVQPSAVAPSAVTLSVPARASAPVNRTAARTSLASATPAAPSASEVAFTGEINQLQSVLVQRRAQLDPETVKIVEDNLKLIDTAVKRARSALVKDPASGFLMRQLDNALQKKVELLRTVALLPAST